MSGWEESKDPGIKLNRRRLEGLIVVIESGDKHRCAVPRVRPKENSKDSGIPSPQKRL